MYYVQVNNDVRIGIDSYNTVILQKKKGKLVEEEEILDDEEIPADPKYKTYGYFGARNLDTVAKVLINLEVKETKKALEEIDTLEGFIKKFDKAVSKIQRELSKHLEVLEDTMGDKSSQQTILLEQKKEITKLKRALTLANKEPKPVKNFVWDK